MSRLDNNGTLLLSGLRDEVSVLKRGETIPRVLSRNGTYAQWYDAHSHVAIWQDLTGPSPRIVAMSLDDAEPRVVLAQPCNGLAANAGRFVSFLNDSGSELRGLSGDLPPNLANDLIARQRASLAPDWSVDGRGPMGRDGTLAYVEDYHSTGPLRLHAKDALATTAVAPQAPYGVHVVGQGQATWNRGGIGVNLSGRFPGALWGMSLDAPDGQYWADSIEGVGFCVYRAGDRFGRLVAAAAFHPDAVVDPHGEIVVGYSIASGELPGEARIVGMYEPMIIVKFDPPIVVVPPADPVVPPADPADPVHPPTDDGTPPDEPTDSKPPIKDEDMPTKLPPFDFHEWIKIQYPKVRAAYVAKQGHEPNDEWAAFQTARWMSKWTPKGEYWPIERMLAEEANPGSTRSEDWPQP